jgi:hypothetical protein
MGFCTPHDVTISLFFWEKNPTSGGRKGSNDNLEVMQGAIDGRLLEGRNKKPTAVARQFWPPNL